MKYLTAALFFLAVGIANASSGFDRYHEPVEEALEQNPESAADIAMAKGDFSLLMVPDCFMGMPGYKGSEPPKISPKVLGKTCEELLGTTAKEIDNLKEWAKKYNARIQEQQHNNQLNKD